MGCHWQHYSFPEVLYDPLTPTHARGHATAQFLPPYAGVLSAADHPVCSLLCPVARTPGSRRHPHVPTLLGDREETRAALNSDHGQCSALAVQGHPEETLGDR